MLMMLLLLLLLLLMVIMLHLIVVMRMLMMLRLLSLFRFQRRGHRVGILHGLGHFIRAKIRERGMMEKVTRIRSLTSVIELVVR